MTGRPIAFALNHIVAPGRSTLAFFELARELGIEAVEIRNDLAGVALDDGTSPVEVGRQAQRLGLRILSINALQRFNDWNRTREDEARSLIAAAAACGAESIVLCPVNDIAFRQTGPERQAGLRRSLEALRPLLREAGVVGMIEPLGFAESSLRLKSDAVEAIRAVGGAGVFRLLHDTFHHHVAGEADFFADRTGLVHISGVTDPTVTADRMRDPHRVLVDDDDRIDNLGQIASLMALGYHGAFSFEPFSDAVTSDPDVAANLRRSLQVICAGLQADA